MLCHGAICHKRNCTLIECGRTCSVKRTRHKTCSLSCTAPQLSKEEYVVYRNLCPSLRSCTCAGFFLQVALWRVGILKTCLHLWANGCFELVQNFFRKSTSLWRFFLNKTIVLYSMHWFKYSTPVFLFHDGHISTNRPMFLKETHFTESCSHLLKQRTQYLYCWWNVSTKEVTLPS